MNYSPFDNMASKEDCQMRRPTVRALARSMGLASDELLIKLRAIGLAVESGEDEVNADHIEARASSLWPILVAGVLLAGFAFAVWRLAG